MDIERSFCHKETRLWKSKALMYQVIRKPDWAKVKKAGINFAILRIHQKNGPDTSFEHNYKGCRANKIAVGGYKYSYALTEAQALKEAEETLAVLDGRELDLPVFYDLEWEKQRKLGKEAVEKIAVVFLDHIKKQDTGSEFIVM